MTRFNFTTNIEHRMSDTGRVFCIDRMTSDYAEQHPLDVDGFIESVYQEFAGTEFEESRESLRSVWTAVLAVKSPRGDASLFPNKNGARRAAAMKVWGKAGDYWRRGLRIGDTLPDMVPMTKITRLDGGGWIALFPKDEHLLSISSNPEILREEEADTNNIEPVRNQSEPRQLDLFEQLQQENTALQARIAELERQHQQPAIEEHQRPVREEQGQHGRSERFARSEDGSSHPWLQVAGYLGAATVALVLIYETGLIIPVGLIGLATSGLLK